MRLGLVFAAGFHFILSAFEPVKFSFFSACVVLFMAETKLRMKWQWELIPPVYPSVNLFAAPVYMNELLYIRLGRKMEVHKQRIGAHLTSRSLL